MKIVNHKCFSLEKKGEGSPGDNIKARFNRIDSVMKYFKSIRPEDLNRYVKELKGKLDTELSNFKYDMEAFDWGVLREGLELIPNYPELEESVYHYMCKILKLPENYKHEQGKITLSFYDRIKAGETISYYLVSSFIDIYGKKEGIEIYKQIVPHLIEERRAREKQEEPEDPKTVTILDSNNRAIESWCEIGLVDFSFCIFDDYKLIYRFDRCLTPEALKEFNDPDIAYLATCYIGDAPEFNEGRTIHMRRTQTLHHAKFCDEFYWNNYVYPDVEQPDLEFTEKMGKDA